MFRKSMGTDMSFQEYSNYKANQTIKPYSDTYNGGDSHLAVTVIIPNPSFFRI